MEKWKAVNRKDYNDSYEFKAKDYEEAKHWVINHLDCSNEWTIYNISPEVPECNHIIGLISLEEDDEFVIAHEGDDMDWEAGNNTKFNFCPKCGEKL